MRTILVAAALAAWLVPLPARADDTDDLAYEMHCAYETLPDAQKALVDKAVADPDGKGLAAAVELVTTAARHCALVYEWPESRIGLARDAALATRLMMFQIGKLGDDDVAIRLQQQVVDMSDEETRALDRAGEAGLASDAALNARVEQILEKAGVKPAQRKAALPLLFSVIGLSLLAIAW